ncbi:MAG: oxaloacetate decarboxylase [Phycisphaerae bacterium]|nr:MAG: oxaloacetate decarboxylase [Phycisphaerae bacterium]
MSMTRLVDTSLRDGHQSLLATRMSTEQCMRVLPMLRDSGYDILELWGGATLDSALRFTGDDPFERLDRFAKCLGTNGPVIRSLCRGQNLFGYSPYADNVVVAFLKESVRSGNRRVRIFDALNDPRNITVPIMAVKTYNGHAEAAISYTTSPVHHIDHFVNFARSILDLGADSLAIKDMAGLLHPETAYDLIRALQTHFPGIPITLHSHCTNGLAITSYVVALLLGVDYIDTAYGPMAGSTSQPPVELMSYFARELGIDLGIDLKLIPRIDAALRGIRQELQSVDTNPQHIGRPWPVEPDPKIKTLVRQAVQRVREYQSSRDKNLLEQAISLIEDQLMIEMGYPPVDRRQLDAQVPGGMISNLHHQLKEQGKLDLLPKILEEVSRVRKAAGYVPLVTPTSQIIGTQAAFNVMTGIPYSMMTREFKALIAGRYGRLPAEPDPDVLQKVLETGEKLCTRRPADYVDEVDLDQILTSDHNIRSHRDVLLSILFPGPAKQFFAKRKASENVHDSGT